MATIWKFPLHEISDVMTVSMPQGARVLCVQVQRGVLCVWALVDPHQPKTERQFRVLGTGGPADSAAGCAYIGTVQLNDGALVLHLFEVPGP